MRLLCYLAALLFLLSEFSHAQQPVAPPVEIVVPAGPEEIPPPAASRSKRVIVEGRSTLRPGMFVSSEVELYPYVRVEDAEEICYGAVPMVVAVMDPREGPWHPHYNRWRHRHRHYGSTKYAGVPLVFVKVMVPPTPPRRVRVQHEEIELDYGDYQVNIDAEDGVVEVEYDD